MFYDLWLFTALFGQKLLLVGEPFKDLCAFGLSSITRPSPLSPSPSLFSPDVVFPEELHAHHSEDEDDDAEDEGEVGERPHRVHHDRQDVVQRLPGLRQLEHPNEESVNGGFDYFYEDFLTIKRFPERFSSRKIAMILQRIKHCRHHFLISLKESELSPQET